MAPVPPTTPLTTPTTTPTTRTPAATSPTTTAKAPSSETTPVTRVLGVNPKAQQALPPAASRTFVQKRTHRALPIQMGEPGGVRVRAETVTFAVSMAELCRRRPRRKRPRCVAQRPTTVSAQTWGVAEQ
jgi:hypothetical protein